MTSSNHSEPITRKRILKRHRDTVSDKDDVSRVSGVSFQIVYRELIWFNRHNVQTKRLLPEDLWILESLPVGLLTPVEIPVPVFQESKGYNIHSKQSTGTLNSRIQGSRKDGVCVMASKEEINSALRDPPTAKLVALFKIWYYTSKNSVHRLTGIQFASPVHSGCLSNIHGLVTVQLRRMPVRLL